MRKMAFIFPGQGAQYVGMGKDIALNYKQSEEIFDIANEILRNDIKSLCFEGPEDELMKTENTQPAILATSIAILKIIEESGIKADVTAGLSLGEYAALVYSGVLDFKETVELVRKRGKYMQEVVPQGKGAMAAILGLDREIVNTIIEECSVKGVIEGANYNCPGQIVLSGETETIKLACDIAKDKGAKRAVILPVSAPFHCSLLKPAGEMLKKELENISISDINVDIISNVTGNYIDNKDKVKELLINQVSNSVLWEDTIDLMIKDGINTFVEIGPGKTLTAFVKKTAKKHGVKVESFNIENVDSLKEFLNTFK
ncbi:malonyl CoA-acyl carrier protein transacylase FabD [Gottschalkia purinilytica]|uniref:Malonyl CoA-acyl carrier protein transacylase n=1 Tax=Gottschalkia purinilytica TaxID=1503 RepID=A0A0L0WB71_GOTPU|nr:ACP S-malonyltransferase [Gottschalkia purinilytica]KNF08774.1 malonyl CoA-acyl carrier protein transacylase FabD [Gottschalkia purinilytica]